MTSTRLSALPIDYNNEKIRHLASRAWAIAHSQIDVPVPETVRFQFEFARLIAFEAAIAAGHAQDAKCCWIGDYVYEELGFEDLSEMYEWIHNENQVN